ncbi:MAG: NAD(P)-binding domain-containing protein [Clostridiales bacterium]|nr:NAD(P)-binding domain-containing protein [Clostridiales bacterium]
MTDLKEKTIAVLGGGAIGKAIAGDCALSGNKVRICDIKPFAETSLFRVKENGIKIHGEQLSLFGFERSGIGKMEMVTTNIKEAVEGAEIVIIATPSAAHDVFFKELIPELEDDMVIHFIPDNYGSLKLRKAMRDTECNKHVIIGGWAGPPFDARVDIEGGITMPSVKLGYRAINLKGSALPYSDQEAFVKSTDFIGAFDSVNLGEGIVDGDTILGTCLSITNPLLHTVGLLMGVGVLENFTTILGQKIEDFSIYSHAFCPSISKVQYAFYTEQLKIANAMGLEITKYEKEQFFSRESIIGLKYMGPDFKIPFESINYVGWGTGPTSINSRYLTEDIPVGCRILHLLGKNYGVKTPIINSMITLASAVLEKDYFEEGYSLEDIGIADMSNNELQNYLRKGI